MLEYIKNTSPSYIFSDHKIISLSTKFTILIKKRVHVSSTDPDYTCVQLVELCLYKLFSVQRWFFSKQYNC